VSKGFRDEAKLWDYMRPKMRGKWERVELAIGPEGFFDLMGSFEKKLIFVERKISDAPNRSLVEPGQFTFAEWMMSCGHECFFVWGGRTSKNVLFTKGLDFTLSGLCRPPFWRG
jgi:hypothetical protein